MSEVDPLEIEQALVAWEETRDADGKVVAWGALIGLESRARICANIIQAIDYKRDVQKTPGVIPLTPELMKQISENLDGRRKDIAERFPGLVKDAGYDVRLAVTEWVFRHLVDHATEGGTFRYLIYDRLGFGPDSYFPLYNAGGMTISNEFDLREEGSESAAKSATGDEK